MRWPRIEGLYAITPDIADTAALIRMARQILVGGARLVQYRNKSATEALRLEQAHSLASLCREFRVPLIVNDHLDLAIEVSADGVHLGFDDTPIAHARRKLGTRKIIGASCYNNLEQALEAEHQRADYVAFGAFFASTTKPHAVAATKELLRGAKALLRVPVVAIGGITARNAMELINEGADALAVSHAVFAASDVQSEAQTFARLFERRDNFSH
ncbi:MAG TPA: thiamine phosphate synthase [Nitrosospira sp.]|nr:thiamine phosphate synthase [Nitrosospira sp.]